MAAESPSILQCFIDIQQNHHFLQDYYTLWFLLLRYTPAWAIICGLLLKQAVSPNFFCKVDSLNLQPYGREKVCETKGWARRDGTNFAWGFLLFGKLNSLDNCTTRKLFIYSCSGFNLHNWSTHNAITLTKPSFRFIRSFSVFSKLYGNRSKK